METLTTTPETPKSTFPPLVIDFETLVKANKNPITDWLKSQLQKSSPEQCTELMVKCTSLLQKPADGKEHKAVLDAKWKLIGEIRQGSVVFESTAPVTNDSEFKRMLLWITILKGQALTDFVKDIVDFIPKAKPHTVEAGQ